MSARVYSLSIDQIRRFLPHRQPFLLVDRVLGIKLIGEAQDRSLESKVGVEVEAIKSVSYNEPFFQGHFPKVSVMPGVLIVEALAQTASFSVYPFIEEGLEKFVEAFQCTLVGVDNARFRKMVIPGDVLRMKSVVTKCRGKIWMFHCEAEVDGQKVAEADLIANMLPSISDWKG